MKRLRRIDTTVVLVVTLFVMSLVESLGREHWAKATYFLVLAFIVMWTDTPGETP